MSPFEKSDLIIICAADLGKLVLARVRVDCPPQFLNIALEYDPSWPQFGRGGRPPLSERDRAACKRLAWPAPDMWTWSCVVWFIDYSLRRRREDADAYSDVSATDFWGATGRFVAVRDCDEEWHTGPEDGVHKLVARA